MKKHIPNTITCCNLISGCIATFWAFYFQYDLALLFIIIGAVFDFFDGMSARLLGVSSPIGKELDSLADVVTFGVAPASMVFSVLCGINASNYLPDPIDDIIPFTAFIIAGASALRLAKFNLDERQSLGFIGLPTPANALFWGALIVGGHDYLSQPWVFYAILVLILISSWILNAEIPMFALKFKHWDFASNKVKYLFLISCLPILALLQVLGIAVVIAWYVLLSTLTQKKAS